MCPNATWNSNATTFASSNLVGSQPFKVFVNANDTVYLANQQIGRVLVWPKGTSAPTRNITGLNAPWALFVTTSGNIYVNNGGTPLDRIHKITTNSSSNVSVMYTCGRCFDIFIDTSNNLYCSMNDNNLVVMKSLNSDSNTVTVVAGTSSAGSAANMLSGPNGIFVDINLNLYVADHFNNRIQMFQAGQLNALTVAGNGSSILLNGPTAVILDANGYLYISDYLNHRVVRSGVNGLECIVGCSGAGGSQSDQLNRPRSLSFDSYGNLFVADGVNNRIQKFLLLTNSCGKYERKQLPKPRLCKRIHSQIK